MTSSCAASSVRDEPYKLKRRRHGGMTAGVEDMLVRLSRNVFINFEVLFRFVVKSTTR